MSKHRASFCGLVVLAALIAVKVASAAESCDDNFKVSGDPRNGATFSTFVTIPDLDPHSALGQMEKMTLDAGFLLGSESYEGDIGTLVVMQKDHNRFLHPSPGFPVRITADKAESRLSISLRLNRDQTIADPTALRSQLCGMLTKVRMDDAGTAIAAQEHALTHSDEIINIKAPDLAAQMTRAMIGHTYDPQWVEAEYVGRTYRIDGQISIPFTPGMVMAQSQAIRDGRNSFDLNYDTARTSLLGGRVASQTSITCHTDPKQLRRFLALRDRDYATLIGKVVRFAGTEYGGALYLDCHFEN